MTKRILFSLAGVLVAGHFVFYSLTAAAPQCGRHACSAAIASCVDSECSGLSGKAAAGCRKDCVAAVQAACESDPTICGAASPSGAFTD